MESAKKINKKIIFTSVILILVFIFSLVFYLIQTNSNRRIFLFESLDDDKVHIEIRYLPKIEKEKQIQQYIDELLLGPLHDRYRPLFSRNTKILSCFQRDNVLYLDLSEEAILQSGISSETIKAVELLEKNIKKNFHNINEVILFMMGVEVYTQGIIE